MLGEVCRRFQRAVEARGAFGVLVQQLFDFTHAPVHGHDFVGVAQVVLFAQLFQFFGETGDVAHMFAETEVQRNQPGVKLFADGLAELGVEFFDLLLDQTFQIAVVEGFERGGVDAHVAEHELGAQQAHFKVGHVAEAGQEQGLPDVREHEADAGFRLGQGFHVHFAAHFMEREQAAVHASAGAVDGDVQTVQSLKGGGVLDADDGGDAELAGGDGRVAGVAAHVGENGGGHAHAGNHVRVGAFGGEDFALAHAVQFQRGTEEADLALTGASGRAVTGQQHFGGRGGLGFHFAAAHEDGVRVQGEFFVPAGFGTRLHEPEHALGVDAELGVHDHAVVGLAHGADALGDLLGLRGSQRPQHALAFRHGDFLGAAVFVVDDLHGLAAHEADHDFAAVVLLVDVQLVRGHAAAHHGLAEAVAGVDAHEVLANRAAASGGGVGAEGRTGHDRVDHAHDAHGQGRVFDGPFFLGLRGELFLPGGFGLGQGVEDGLAAVDHGAQVVGRGAVPHVGGRHGVFAHHVQEGVLKAGEGFLAGVLARGGRTHGHRHVGLFGFGADVAVGGADGLIHLGRDGAGQNGGLYHDGAFAELVDAFLRRGEAVDHVVDERTQTDAGQFRVGFGSLADVRGDGAHELGQEVVILGDFFGRPVDAAVGVVDHGADQRRANLAFVENDMERHGRNGAELGNPYAFNAADQGRVVVFAAHQQFGFLADPHDIRAGQNQALKKVFHRNLVLSVFGCGRGFRHENCLPGSLRSC